MPGVVDADDQGRPARLRLRTANLEWRAVEGEVVAVDLDRSLYLGTNESGALMWEALARGATEDELVERLAARYGLAAAEAKPDVHAFLGSLSDQALLES